MQFYLLILGRNLVGAGRVPHGRRWCASTFLASKGMCMFVVIETCYARDHLWWMTFLDKAARSLMRKVGGTLPRKAGRFYN
jgi:hypothetical protein